MFHVRSTLSKARTRWREQRGAVIVETAIAIPILLTVIMGSIEFGFAWEAKSATASGVRTGVLRAASIGDQPETDMRILQSIIGEIGAENVDRIEYVLVFNATGHTDKQAAIDGCAAGAGTTQCVRYPNAILDEIAKSTDPAGYQAANFDLGGNVTYNAGVINGYACTFGKLDTNWCAGSRTVLNDVEIGVAVKYNHKWVTGIIPFDAPDFNDYSISSTFLSTGSSITATGVGPIGGSIAYASGFTVGATPFGFTNGTVVDPPADGAPDILGVFGGSQSTTLELTSLAVGHTELCVSFDLHVIGNWEDSGGFKDTWQLKIDNDLVVNESSFKGGETPAGATASDTFGYSNGDEDFTVRISRCVTHSGSTATIDFVGLLTSGMPNEGWAISNIQVSTT